MVSAVSVVLQPESHPPATRTAATFTTAGQRPRHLPAGAMRIIVISSQRPSIQNEAVIAAIGMQRINRTGRTRSSIQAIETAQQIGGRIGGVGEAVVRPRQI